MDPRDALGQLKTQLLHNFANNRPTKLAVTQQRDDGAYPRFQEKNFIKLPCLQY